jgi:putative DNA primase/helicase
LLARLLRGCFQGDEDAQAKIDILSEVAAAAALGYGTRLIAPKAIVFLGRSAENGKSQVIHLLRGLLPESAVSAIPPSKFGDERHVIRLVGKLLNTSDELGTTKAVSSDIFKYLVTGESVSARNVYEASVDFRAMAQHVFACNQLPGFQGGMDRGVMRRLMVLMFNRTIPSGERVDRLADRILAEELDLVLSWVVDGAGRLLRRREFSTVPSSKSALQEWAQGADVVQGWLAERVWYGSGLTMTTRKAYEEFKIWALGEGYSPYSLPAVNTFSQRLKGAGLEYKHSGGFKGFLGVGAKEMLDD